MLSIRKLLNPLLSIFGVRTSRVSPPGNQSPSIQKPVEKKEGVSNGEPTLEELAEQVASLTKAVAAHIKSEGLPKPSSAKDGPQDFPQLPQNVALKRALLLEKIGDLQDLLYGPAERLRNMLGRYLDIVALHYIYHYNIASAVPLDSAISYADLATKLSLPESQLRRVLRYAATVQIFAESPANHVSHTALSTLLATRQDLQDYCGHIVEFSMHCCFKLVEATERWGGDAQEPNQTAFNLAFDTDDSMFKYMATHRDVSERFSRLMRGLMSSERFSLRHLVNGFDWAALGPEAKVVDVGGSKGITAKAIAEAYTNLRVVVEDLPYVVAQAQEEPGATIGPELRERVSFLAHDFFEEQPVKDADVYLLRQIFHDWSDSYACRILKRVVDAMKPGARVVIMDQVVPPPGVLPPAVERAARHVDLIMMANLNGKERGMDDWKSLFKMVDPRLKIKSCTQQPECVFSVIELVIEEEVKEEIKVNGQL